MFAGPVQPPLCLANDACFWPWYAWTDLANWPDPGATTVVIPIVGLADCGLELPLDAGEGLALGILKLACDRGALPDKQLLIVPPLRFVAGPHDACAFAVDPELAIRAMTELALSVRASGFTRIVLYNASPWNEDVVDVAARDIRIDHGLQLFVVNLSAFGLRVGGDSSSDGRQILAAWNELIGETEHRPILDAAARKLSSLLMEIRDRPKLASGGALRRVVTNVSNI